jgi:hypothetical protein
VGDYLWCILLFCYQLNYLHFFQKCDLLYNLPRDYYQETEMKGWSDIRKWLETFFKLTKIVVFVRAQVLQIAILTCW